MVLVPVVGPVRGREGSLEEGVLGGGRTWNRYGGSGVTGPIEEKEQVPAVETSDTTGQEKEERQMVTLKGRPALPDTDEAPVDIRPHHGSLVHGELDVVGPWSVDDVPDGVEVARLAGVQGRGKTSLVGVTGETLYGVDEADRTRTDRELLDWFKSETPEYYPCGENTRSRGNRHSVTGRTPVGGVGHCIPEVDIEGALLAQGQTTLTQTVYTGRSLIPQVPRPVPPQTEDVGPVGLRTGEVDVGCFVPVLPPGRLRPGLCS